MDAPPRVGGGLALWQEVGGDSFRHRAQVRPGTPPAPPLTSRESRRPPARRFA